MTVPTPRFTARLAGAAMALALASVGVAAQEGFSELCTGPVVCLDATGCKDDTLSFRFIYSADGDGTQNMVVMPGEAPVTAVADPSTQGFTWSDSSRVYAMLYLYNAAHADTDPAEFMLVASGIDTTIEDAILVTGTCEVVN